jgi:pyruvate kinase
LKAGQTFRFYCKKGVDGNEDFIGVDFTNLAKKLKIGDHIVINYGKAYLKVVGFETEDEFLEEQAKKDEGKDLG